MSALDSLISTGGEAPLLESLSFDLPPASTAVVDRKQNCRAYPTSASTLSTNGTKTCRIRLGGNDFCNADSVRLQYTLTNRDAISPLYPETGPWGVWGQVRLLSNGVELDNIPCYARHHELHGYRLTSTEQQYNEAIYGWDGSFKSNPDMQPDVGVLAQSGGTQTVSHKLLLSLFTAGKMLPLRYAPLELELTLAPMADFLSTSRHTGTGGAALSATTAYDVSDIQLIYDSSVLDEAVQESFYKALLSNRVLNIPCQQFHQVYQVIPGGSSSYTFSVVRAFSRLAMVWVTFKSAGGSRASKFTCPTSTIQDDEVSEMPVFFVENAPSVRLSCGPKNWPDPQPVTTFHEHFHMLQKAVPHPIALDRSRFTTDTFVSAFDLRRTPGDPTSSLSTRSGDLLRIDCKNLTPNVATEIWVTMWAFGVCAIRESGVTLLD